MSKDLVWLENYSFAAWGCAACSWIKPNVDRKLSGQASSSVRAAFDKHDCRKFPRFVPAKDKRTSRGSGLALR